MTHGLAFGMVQGEDLLEGCVGFLVGDKVGQKESAEFPKQFYSRSFKLCIYYTLSHSQKYLRQS